ncbi:hypothetical protein Tsubulata_016122 [Turnera subulata]|uniref:Uncharacterized protein n=1 Tax=Turnera subulata TaxID=218843 RepID=A0A9Q0JNV1_9ROSI|nr:hypothetical protein Tsubulata_016122 [Turnera subulata]
MVGSDGGGAGGSDGGNNDDDEMTRKMKRLPIFGPAKWIYRWKTPGERSNSTPHNDKMFGLSGYIRCVSDSGGDAMRQGSTLVFSREWRLGRCRRLLCVAGTVV